MSLRIDKPTEGTGNQLESIEKRYVRRRLVWAKKTDSLRFNPGKYALGDRYEIRKPIVNKADADEVGTIFSAFLRELNYGASTNDPQLHPVEETEQDTIDDLVIELQKLSLSSQKEPQKSQWFAGLPEPHPWNEHISNAQYEEYMRTPRAFSSVYADALFYKIASGGPSHPSNTAKIYLDAESRGNPAESGGDPAESGGDPAGSRGNIAESRGNPTASRGNPAESRVL